MQSTNCTTCYMPINITVCACRICESLQRFTKRLNCNESDLASIGGKKFFVDVCNRAKFCGWHADCLAVWLFGWRLSVQEISLATDEALGLIPIALALDSFALTADIFYFVVGILVPLSSVYLYTDTTFSIILPYLFFGVRFHTDFI